MLVGLLITYAAGLIAVVVGASIAGLPLGNAADPAVLAQVFLKLVRCWIALVSLTSLGYAVAMVAKSQMAGIGTVIGYFIASIIGPACCRTSSRRSSSTSRSASPEMPSECRDRPQMAWPQRLAPLTRMWPFSSRSPGSSGALPSPLSRSNARKSAADASRLLVTGGRQPLVGAFDDRRRTRSRQSPRPRP